MIFVELRTTRDFLAAAENQNFLSVVRDVWKFQQQKKLSWKMLWPQFRVQIELCALQGLE
jgi:hypothetical protein